MRTKTDRLIGNAETCWASVPSCCAISAKLGLAQAHERCSVAMFVPGFLAQVTQTTGWHVRRLIWLAHVVSGAAAERALF